MIKVENAYRKEHWTFNDKFKPIHDSLMKLLIKGTIPLKKIRFGFQCHFCEIDCRDSIKIFWRYSKHRMNYPKIVFKVKNFEIEADQNNWDEIIIKKKEIDVETKGGGIYFVFTKPVDKLFNENKISKKIIRKKGSASILRRSKPQRWEI